MSRPPISHMQLNPAIGLSECHPDSECRAINWWLYDKRAGLNIAMRAKTRDEAFVGAIEYWAKRAQRYEREYFDLKVKVDSFVDQFTTSIEE